MPSLFSHWMSGSPRWVASTCRQITSTGQNSGGVLKCCTSTAHAVKNSTSTLQGFLHIGKLTIEHMGMPVLKDYSNLNKKEGVFKILLRKQ